MIKLKDILLENEAPDIFIPRRVEDRPVRYNQMTQKEVNRIVDDYNNKKNKDSLDLSGSDPEEYDGDAFSRSELSFSGDFILPDILKKVEGGLYLAATGVTKLPDNLTIGDYNRNKIYSNSHLDVSYCKNLNALPKGLKVVSVNGSYSGLIEIPDDIQTIELNIIYTKVKQLPLFKNFIKNIDLEGCKSFKTLPEGFTAGELTIEYSPIVSIPNNVKLKHLVVRECKNFTSIGSNCSIDILFIGYSCPSFTTLPTDIKADLLNLTYINTPLRIQLFNKYKTKPKVLKALKIMYPNVKEFQLG
jgi:hypothetical protein